MALLTNPCTLESIKSSINGSDWLVSRHISCLHIAVMQLSKVWLRTTLAIASDEKVWRPPAFEALPADLEAVISQCKAA